MIRRLHVVSAALAAVFAFHFALAPASAQDKNEPWEIQIAYGPNENPKEFPRVALRPNVAQALFLHLKNPAALARKNLDLSLVRIAADGKTQVLGLATIEKIPGNQMELIKWKPLPPPKDQPPSKAIEGKEAKPPEELAFFGLPFQFQIWLKEGNKDLVKLDLPLTIQQPHEYVTAQASFDRKRDRLAVEVKGDPDFLDPPCKVDLGLYPELVPGLI